MKTWITLNAIIVDIFVLSLISLFIIASCTVGGYEWDRKESGNDDDTRVPRICFTVTGVSLFDLNAGMTAWWLDGEKCQPKYDRDGKLIGKDCGYGELENQPNPDMKQCLDITDAAVPDQNIEYGIWHACSGYVSGTVSLSEDSELELPVIAEGYCTHGVPTCSAADAVWTKPFSDGRIVLPGYSVEDCCQYPGTSVQEICSCPSEWIVCDKEVCQCIIDPAEAEEETVNQYQHLYDICIGDGWSPLLCCETFYVASDCPDALTETCDPIYAANVLYTNPCNPTQ